MPDDLSALTSAYLQAVAEEWGFLDVGEGRRRPLTSLFMMLQARREAPPEPLRPSRADLTPDPQRLSDAGLTSQWMSSVPQTSPPMPLGKALQQAQRLILLGEPGAGKSTALQFVGLCFAKPDENWAADRLGIEETRYPILLSLQAAAAELAQGGDAMTRALARQVQAKLQKEDATARTLVETWAGQGRLFVLLDGLDEVPQGQLDAVRRQILDFIRSPVAKGARLIVTSRLAGFSALADLPEFVLKPFDDPQKEVLPYLAGWLGASKDEWVNQADAKAAELLQKMQAQPGLRRVLDNPLLLRLAAQLYAATGEIARNRADLYRRHVDEMWQRAVRRGAPAGEKETCLRALDVLAWHLQCGGEPDESALANVLQTQGLARTTAEAEDVLHCLREKMGLLAGLPAKKETVYIFAPQTLREYFVGQHLRQAWQQNPGRTFAFLRLRLHLPAWREPLALLAGGLEMQQATELVRWVWRKSGGMAGVVRPYERYLKRDLFLAASLAADAGVWDAVRSSLLPQLLAALQDENGTVRWAAAGALGEIGDASAIPALLAALRDEDGFVREAAAEVLEKIGDASAIPALLAALRDENPSVCWAAAWALGEIGDASAIPALLAALQDEDSAVRGAAARALGAIGDASAIPALLAALRDEDDAVRGAAAGALATLLSRLTVPRERPARAALLAQIRQIIRISAKMHARALLMAALEQESTLLVAASSWQDPLLPPPVPGWRVWGKRAVVGLAAIVLAGLTALVAAALSGAQKIIEDAVKTLLQTRPLWAVALAVVVLAALAALIGWGWERIGKGKGKGKG